MPKSSWDIIIIGGGPAGMSAAIYAARGGKKCLIIERESFGGQIATSPKVENLPSIKSISGLEFSNMFFDQISDLGVQFELEDVESVTKVDDVFNIHTNYNDYEANAVIIASGLKHRHLNLDREEELTGKGISYCAVCDGAFYKGKDVIVIGDANTALQYTILMANYCNKVKICTLFDKFFGDQILIDKMKSLPNVTYENNLMAIEYLGKDELTGVRFINTQTKEKTVEECAACFIAIGQIPDNDRYGDLVELKNGFIVVDNLMQTKTPGLFAAGDCTFKEVKQVTTAVNDGAIAATIALRYLSSK